MEGRTDEESPSKCLARGKEKARNRESGKSGAGAKASLMPVLFSSAFSQLLGGTAGRATEPAEEEYMQRRGKYVAEQGNVVGRLIASVFFKGKDMSPAHAAFPGKRQGEIENHRQNPGAEAEAD